MKIDFSKRMFQLDGTAVEMSSRVDGGKVVETKPLTFGTVAIESLMVQYQDEKDLTGTEKMRRFELALEVSKAVDHKLGVGDITSEQASLLKSLIAKGYSSLIVGQAWSLLDGKPNPLEPEEVSA